MPRSVSCALIASTLCLISAAATAQDKLPPGAEPQLTFVLRSSDEGMASIDYVLGLTNEKEQKQRTVVKDYLDIFLLGIDRTRPIRGGFILEEKDPNLKADEIEDYRRYLWDFPIAKKSDFDDNLDSFGIEIKRIRNTDVRALQGAFPGFLLYLPSDYATIAERREDLTPPGSKPAEDVQPLLKANYQLVAHVSNIPEGMEQRREVFAVGARGFLDRLKRDTDETEAWFALRKSRVQFRFNELERLYAEAKEAYLGASLDQKAESSRVEGYVEPLEGSSLAAALDLVGTAPSRFASVPRSKVPVLSGRVNHPLDDVRKQNMIQLLAAFRDWSVSHISTLDRTAEEKAASEQVAKMIGDHLEQGINAGLLEGFIEVRPSVTPSDGGDASSSKGHNAVAGMTTVNGENIIEILKLIPATRAGRTAELDVATEGDVRIHKLGVPKEDNPDFFEFVGTQEFYVGTSPDVIYFAAGPNGIEELKQTINQVAEPDPPEAASIVAEGFIELEEWMKLYHKRVKGGNALYRELAIAAFAEGDDTLEFKLNKVENRMEGWGDAKLGVLRWIGKMIADFSKENLDET